MLRPKQTSAPFSAREHAGSPPVFGLCTRTRTTTGEGCRKASIRVEHYFTSKARDSGASFPLLHSPYSVAANLQSLRVACVCRRVAWWRYFARSRDWLRATRFV